MNDRLPFNPLQAQEVARAFNTEKDLLDLHLLELFLLEFEARNP
jgi:hypothetical protein